MNDAPFRPFDTHLDEAAALTILRAATAGADDGELFVERRRSEAIVLDDGRIKTASYDASEGFGLRAVRGEVAGYAHSTEISESALIAFTKLFEQLGLPLQQLDTLAGELLAAKKSAAPDTASSAAIALLPQRVDQLVWLGLPARTVTVLSPYITVLPYRTKVNINTASAEVIHASVPGLDLADARRMLAARESAHFATISDARLPGAVTAPSGSAMLTVTSDFFEVRGRLRLDQAVVEEISLVRREGLKVTTLWRERATALARPPGS